MLDNYLPFKGSKVSRHTGVHGGYTYTLSLMSNFLCLLYGLLLFSNTRHIAYHLDFSINLCFSGYWLLGKYPLIASISVLVTFQEPHR
jgi:hypothetical protein